jgi:uncharacterized membrane protein
MLLTGYRLAATAYVETTLILFLHVLGAMATMGGVLGVLVLYLRARGASDAEDLRVTLRIMDVFNQRVLMPAAGLTGVIGFLLVLRYDMRGIFEFSRQGWLFVAVVLWVILQGVAGQAVRAAHKALGPLDGEGGLAAARAQLGSAGVAGPVWLTLILTVAIVYFMMFQPFVRS